MRSNPDPTGWPTLTRVRTGDPTARAEDDHNKAERDRHRGVDWTGCRSLQRWGSRGVGQPHRGGWVEHHSHFDVIIHLEQQHNVDNNTYNNDGNHFDDKHDEHHNHYPAACSSCGRGHMGGVNGAN